MSTTAGSSLPGISIVTPCLDRRPFLAEALASAASCPGVEHIVIDGGSTDGSLELLAGWPGLKVVSEPDKGVYDALNKGIRLAAGDVIGILNSDDRYEPGALETVMERFAGDPDLEAVFGGAAVFEQENGRIRTLSRHVDLADIDLSFLNLTSGVPIINARFFRRKVYDRVGFFDPGLSLAADREFLLRVRKAGVRSVSIPQPLYHYRCHPGSLTIGPAARWFCIRSQHLEIAERQLSSADTLDPPAAYREWHSAEAALAVIRSLREGLPMVAWTFARRGWAWNRSWPRVFLRTCLRRLGL